MSALVSLTVVKHLNVEMFISLLALSVEAHVKSII